MENVYDKLNDFYIKNADAKFLFQEKIFERHLRKCAWNGDSEEILNLRFKFFSMVMLSAIDIDADSIYDLLPEDYLEIFYELADFENKKLDENLVKKYLDFLEELFLEREPDGFSGKLEEVEFVRIFFYDEGKFILPKREKKDSFKSLSRRKKATDEEIKQIDFLREKWLNKIFDYFNDPIFEHDLIRAKNLLFGNNNNNLEETDLMFKCYFLFDYHLIKTDETPLEFFCDNEIENLDDISKNIILNYLNSKFTLFYVKREVNGVFLYRDFFREREFFLPYSSEEHPEYKDMIFYGTIEAGSLVIPNFIAMFPAKDEEKERIIKEVNAACKLYGYQEQNLTYAKFFKRHSLAVRQIVHSVLNLSRFNIIPDMDAEIIKTDQNILEDYEAPVKTLINMGASINLSQHSLNLLEKYYHDFLVKSKFTRGHNESMITLFAVLNSFLIMNSGGKYSVQNNILPFEIDPNQIITVMDEITEILSAKYFDPRYLTEEGFSSLIHTTLS